MFLNKVLNTRFAVLLPLRVKNNTTDCTDSHRLRVKIFFNLCISELSVLKPMTGIPLDWTHCQIRNATFKGLPLRLQCLLLDVHCLPLRSHCLLLGVHCLPLRSHCLLLGVHCLPLGSHCLLLGVHCLPLRSQCLLLGVHCLPLRSHCLLPGVHCLVV